MREFNCEELNGFLLLVSLALAGLYLVSHEVVCGWYMAAAIAMICVVVYT